MCNRLRSVILGFQDVPATPWGDAGLDAFSHGGERGYCCYGPEHNAFKSNRGRESAIVKKFGADLRRLFELVTKGKRLVHKPNPELATILPNNQRLQHITLIVNWFESHRILSPILTKVAEYKRVSICSYVDPTAAVVVIGPKQLADQYPVDELTILRVQQRTFIQKVQESAEMLTIADPKNFETKINVLRAIRPDQPEAVRELAEGFRSNWRTALAFERELGDTVPSLHQALEAARSQIKTRVAGLMVSSSEPWTQLGRAAEVASEILTLDFGKLYGPLMLTVANGEVARLIGECTIGWQGPITTHG